MAAKRMGPPPPAEPMTWDVWLFLGIIVFDVAFYVWLAQAWIATHP